MKKTFRGLLWAAACAGTFFMACSDDSESYAGGAVEDSGIIADNDTSFLDNGAISGVSQKGPLAKGSSVTVFELDGTNSLKQTGRSFNGTISSNNGSFKIKNVSLVSSYVHLTATGAFREEISGEKSESSITLRALSDLEGGRTSVNVNLITHLEYDRVVYLLENDPEMGLSEAKKQAEKEIFAMFHIDADKFAYSEDLSIFGSDDADAALLAVSVILPTGYSASGIMERLTALSEDMAEDGTWDDKEVMDSLANWAKKIDLDGTLPKIRKNVLSWKISETVPDFEKFVRTFWHEYYGFGKCGKDASVGTVKGMPEGASVDGEDVRYICVDSADVGKVWRVAEDIEKDTMGLGRDFDEGKMKKGLVNKDSVYVFDDGKFRKATEQEIELEKGCTAGTKDAKTKHDGIDYVCTAGAWEYDLSIFAEGEMREGFTDKENTYVFDDGKFRKATEQELELKKGCTAGTEGAKTKHDGIDYVCTAVAWEYDLSIFTEGEMREGFTDKENMYVFENGAFRMADKRELYLNKTCTKAFEGTTLKKEHSAYVCTNGLWEFDLENSDKGTVKDGFDDHVYKTVGIGGQLWMAENVKYYLDNRFYCFEMDAENCETYGATFDIFSFHDAVSFDPSTDPEYMNPTGDNVNYCGVSNGKCVLQEEHQGVCPVGYHIPSAAEFEELMDYVDLFNGNENVATSLKSRSGWKEKGAAGTDRFGFNAIPGGYENAYTHRTTKADAGVVSTFWVKLDEGVGINSMYVRYFSLDATSASFKMQSTGDFHYARCLKNRAD